MPHKDPEARREWMQKYYARNAESIKAKVKKRYEETRPEQLEYRREYFQKNKTVLMEKSRAWLKAHPGYHSAVCKRRNVEQKAEAMNAYGNKCSCCGDSTYELLTIDHITGYKKGSGPRGGKSLYAWLIKNHFPKDFQILCMGCNWGKSNLGICPHQKATERVAYGLCC